MLEELVPHIGIGTKTKLDVNILHRKSLSKEGISPLSYSGNEIFFELSSVDRYQYFWPAVVLNSIVPIFLMVGCGC